MLASFVDFKINQVHELHKDFYLVLVEKKMSGHCLFVFACPLSIQYHLLRKFQVGIHSALKVILVVHLYLIPCLFVLFAVNAAMHELVGFLID